MWTRTSRPCPGNLTQSTKVKPLGKVIRHFTTPPSYLDQRLPPTTECNETSNLLACLTDKQTIKTDSDCADSKYWTLGSMTRSSTLKIPINLLYHFLEIPQIHQCSNTNSLYISSVPKNILPSSMAEQLRRYSENSNLDLYSNCMSMLWVLQTARRKLEIPCIQRHCTQLTDIPYDVKDQLTPPICCV